MNRKNSATHGGIDTGGGNLTGHVIVAGDQIVYGDQNFTQEISRQTLDSLFHPLSGLVRSAPVQVQAEAAEKVNQLKTEVAKGKQRDDNLTAKLIEGIVGLVPSAVSTIASAFGTPILGGLVGPATKYVLDKIQGK
ncbi:MAG: hypothetical protein WCA10_24775 [Terracidiphilus sp.]